MKLSAEDHHYLQTIIIPGSNLYYAARVIPEKLQAIQYPLYALYETLQAIADDCRDPGVARVKLHWWAEQLQRADATANSHPLIRILNQSPLEQAARQSCYQALLRNAFNKLHHYSTLDTQENFTDSHPYRRSVLTTLFTELSPPSENIMFTKKLAEVIDLSEQLIQLGKDQRNKRPRIHKEFVMHYSAHPTQDQQKQLHDAIAQTVCTIKKELHALSQQYQLSKSQYFHLRSEWIYCHLLLKTVSLIENNYCEILQHAISLTPIRKLWIAFYHS